MNNSDILAALDMTSFVFVYGSLKRGYWNNSVIEDQTFVSEGASLAPVFKLYDGGYPVAEFTNDPEAGFLRGELYEIDERGLQACDWLEGHPSFYERMPIFVSTENGAILAWVYVGRSVLNHWDRSEENQVKPNAFNELIWRDADAELGALYG